VLEVLGEEVLWEVKRKKEESMEGICKEEL
jgi:hypothetical protein